MERIEFVKIGAVLVLLAGALAVALTAGARGGPAQAVTAPAVPLELGAAQILGALAFAGAGGAQNLVQSNWIRDKGLGMGARMPKLVSPVTGRPEAAPATGYRFPPDEPNLARWRGWWRVANTEQLVSFVLITVVTITVMSMLAHATVFGREVANDVTFLHVEGEVLNRRTGWFGTFFWIIGAYSLFAAALGILDYMGRLVSDSLKVTYLAASTRWSESALYVAVVWALIAIGGVVLLAGFDQPLALLIVSAVVGGFMMFLYSGLLVILNRRALPREIGLRGYRLVVMGLIFLFFAFFAALTIIDRIRGL
ncbi:hypothetical protein DP939_12245 [Spongiactinospora rosea]|uniref:Uncharacterized protein n=1 Tax=Spongiactinospora rosea TaxID=2248750 RepID=A0A366M262_9ACTN|nr:hypothetical protein DP939_12245 [Spongiactinospora rosea]